MAIKKEILDVLKGLEDTVKAQEYDSSYELVQKTVELYATLLNSDNKFKVKITPEDIDLILAMATDVRTETSLNNKIKKSSLGNEEQEKLIKILDVELNKTKQGQYKNGKDKGMVSYRSIIAHLKNATNEQLEKVVAIFLYIKSEKDPNKIYTKLITANIDAPGVGLASFSIIAHCLKPEVFPIINRENIKMYDLFELPGFSTSMSIEEYAKYSKSLAEFRVDNNLKFKNYRDLDLARDEIIIAHKNITSSMPSIGTSKQRASVQKGLNIPKNIILYGPPGTGKTYNTAQLAVAICDGLNPTINQYLEPAEYDKMMERYKEFAEEGRIVFTTFHQSYGYEEFIEGLFPEIDEKAKQISYKIKDGIFKKFCADNSFDVAWDMIKKDATCGEIKWGDVDPSANEDVKSRLLTVSGKGNLAIPYGNKLPLTEENAKKFYNKQKVENEGLETLKKLYDYFERKYIKNKVANKVFIIDEINRGNISKIFGELITLIEETKRAGAKECIAVKLPYSGDLFSIPNNVYIIGTMNTADRSIALIDTALRRRFSFIEMMPESKVLENHGIDKIKVDGKSLDIANMLNKMNERITILYDREHQIGHSFFFPIKDNQNIETLEAIFKNKIIPLLQEYFYEDYGKIQFVLGDNDKTSDDFKFIKDKKNKIDGVGGVFKGNVGEEINANEVEYEVQDKAFRKIESYIEIYS